MEHERCDACDFDGARYDDAALLDALRGLGPRWRSLLSEAGSELRARPEPEVWSALEYAAHSRDITALHAFRVEQALTLDEPSFPPMRMIWLIPRRRATGVPIPVLFSTNWRNRRCVSLNSPTMADADRAP
jgi:hypothetical protein